MTPFRYYVTYSGTLDAADEDEAVELAVDIVEASGVPDDVEVEEIHAD